jgi:hypothetical protein
MVKVSEIEVKTDIVIVSSLGIVPKATARTLKKMFHVTDRSEIQTVNSSQNECAQQHLNDHTKFTQSHIAKEST